MLILQQCQIIVTRIIFHDKYTESRTSTKAVQMKVLIEIDSAMKNGENREDFRISFFMFS